MEQQDAAAVAPADDSADGEGGAAESVAQVLVEENTATAELLLQDGSATEQQQDEVSTSDAQQVTSRSSSTLALPELDSAAQLHDDTEATEGALSMPVVEPVAEIVQLASVVVTDVHVLAASREPRNSIDEVEANQALRTISQQGLEQKLDVVIDESAIAPAQTTAPVTNHAEHATDGNNTDLVIVEPSAAEVVSILTQTGTESLQIDSAEIKVVQPASVLESAVEDVPVSSTSLPQVSSPEQPTSVSLESSEVGVGANVRGDAVATDMATTEDFAKTSDSAISQEEPRINNANNATLAHTAENVPQVAFVLDSIPDTLTTSAEVNTATTEVNVSIASVLLTTAAIVSSETFSDDTVTAAVTAIDDPQAASDNTIIVAEAATEQSPVLTAVPAVAITTAVTAAEVTPAVTPAVTTAVATQVDSALAALPAEVTTDATISTVAVTADDVPTTLNTTDSGVLCSIPDEVASTTTVSDEKPVIVSVAPESSTAAATAAVTTPSTAAAIVTPALITPAAAAPPAVAAAAAAAAAAASTYVIDGQALTLQHNAENAQAIEALLALVARLQMNTVSVASTTTTVPTTTEAITATTDFAAPLTIAAVKAIPALAAAATVTVDTQSAPDVIIEHDGAGSVSTIHTDDTVLSTTTTNSTTAVSNGTTIVTEANVMAIQEQQLSDETAACVTVEMLPEAPTTAPAAIASFTTAAQHIVNQQQQHDDVLSDADAADLADTSALNDAFDDDNDDTELALQQQQQQQQQQALQADTVALSATTVDEQSSMVHVRSPNHTDSTTEEHKECDDAITTSTAFTDTSKIADVTSDDTITADIAALVTSMVTAVVLKSDSTSNNEATSASNGSTMITTASHYDGAVAALTPLSPERSVHEQLLVNGTLQSDAVTVQTAQSRRSLATNDLTVVVSGTTVNGQEQRVRRRSSMAEYLSSPTQALQQLRAPSDKQRARNDSECENTADSAVDPYREHLGDDFRKTPWKPPSKSIAREDQRYNLFRRGNAKLWKVTNLDLFVLGEGVGLYFVWLNYLMVFTAIATVLSVPAILIR
eukprot:2688-Heterococcus_DN1.PRE.2